MAAPEKHSLDLLRLVAAKGRTENLDVAFCLSLLVTGGLAFAAWYRVEKRALLIKPGIGASL